MSGKVEWKSQNSWVVLNFRLKLRLKEIFWLNLKERMYELVWESYLGNSELVVDVVAILNCVCKEKHTQSFIFVTALEHKWCIVTQQSVTASACWYVWANWKWLANILFCAQKDKNFHLMKEKRIQNPVSGNSNTQHTSKQTKKKKKRKKETIPRESPSSQNSSPAALSWSSRAMIKPMGLRRLVKYT